MLDCSAGCRRIWRPRRCGGVAGDAGEALELLELMMIGAVVGMRSSSEDGPGFGSTSPQRRMGGAGTCWAAERRRGVCVFGFGGTVRQRVRQSHRALASLDT